MSSGRRGSNPPPKAWKAFALPNELLPLDLWGRVDSNHRTDTRTDLQSVAIATMRLPQCLTEPVDGLEPPTGWLQISYSTNWVTSAFSALSNNSLFSCFEVAKILLFSHPANFFSFFLQIIFYRTDCQTFFLHLISTPVPSLPCFFTLFKLHFCPFSPPNEGFTQPILHYQLYISIIHHIQLAFPTTYLNCTSTCFQSLSI